MSSPPPKSTAAPTRRPPVAAAARKPSVARAKETVAMTRSVDEAAAASRAAEPVEQVAAPRALPVQTPEAQPPMGEAATLAQIRDRAAGALPEGPACALPDIACLLYTSPSPRDS